MWGNQDQIRAIWLLLVNNNFIICCQSETAAIYNNSEQQRQTGSCTNFCKDIYSFLFQRASKRLSGSKVSTEMYMVTTIQQQQFRPVWIWYVWEVWELNALVSFFPWMLPFLLPGFVWILPRPRVALCLWVDHTEGSYRRSGCTSGVKLLLKKYKFILVCRVFYHNPKNCLHWSYTVACCCFYTYFELSDSRQKVCSCNTIPPWISWLYKKK